VSLNVQLERSVLDAEANLAVAKSGYEMARLQADVNTELFKDGLVSELERRRTNVAADDADTHYKIEQKRYAFTKDSIAPQLSVKKAQVERLRAQAKLRRDDADALSVRSDMSGILQELPVEVGAQVQPGANLARVVDPTRLKAEIRVAETQAKDILIGQSASIDTRNGLVDGHVSRIDPSVQNGTVTVDVTLTGELPKGARPASRSMAPSSSNAWTTSSTSAARPSARSAAQWVSSTRGRRRARHAHAGAARPQLGQPDRNRQRSETRRQGDPLRYVAMGRQRPYQTELKQTAGNLL